MDCGDPNTLEDLCPACDGLATDSCSIGAPHFSPETSRANQASPAGASWSAQPWTATHSTLSPIAASSRRDTHSVAPSTFGIIVHLASAPLVLRLRTLLIDLLCMTLLSVIIADVSRSLDRVLPPTTLVALVAFLVVTYLPFFWLRGGQTPGMALLGVRLERADQRTSLSLSVVLLRYGALLGSLLLLGLPFMEGEQRPDRRSFADRVAGTRVVRLPH